MKFIEFIDRILEGCTTFMAYFSGAMIIFIMALIGVDVLLRFFLNQPLRWSVEVTEIILLYITFFGTAWVLRRNGHINMDTVLNSLSPRRKRTLNICTSIIGLAISCVLFWWGTQVTLTAFQKGTYESTVMQFPLAPMFISIPIGSFFLIFQFIKKILRLVKTTPADKVTIAKPSTSVTM